MANQYDQNDNPHYTIGYMASKIESLLHALELCEAPTDICDKITYEVAKESAEEYIKSYKNNFKTAI